MIPGETPKARSQWAAIESVAEKIGCNPDLTTDKRQRVKELEREVRELSRANEILRKAALGSIGQRNALIERFRRSPEAQSFPRTLVQSTSNGLDEQTRTACRPG
jgi:transposase-like protein